MSGLPVRWGEQVGLRLLDEADLAVLDPRLRPPGGFNDFGWRGSGDAWTGVVGEDEGRLAVVTRDGSLVGDVGWHVERYGPNAASRALNIGIELMPDERGKGYGSEAQRLLAAYLFAITPVHRVEASTDVGNVAEQRALEKAGFTREGVLRGCQWRDGAWRDLVLYAVLRGELGPSSSGPASGAPSAPIAGSGGGTSTSARVP